MTTDGECDGEIDHAKPMHPSDRRKIVDDLRDDFTAIIEGMIKGPAAPHPTRPPVDLDTFDERQFKQLKEDLVKDVTDLVHEATSRFVPDEEINERLEQSLSEIRKVLDNFKRDILKDVRSAVHDEIEKERTRWIDSCRDLIRSEIERIFTLIGLRIDNPDKIEETRKVIEEMKRLLSTTGEFKKEALSSVLKAFGIWVGVLFTGFLTYLGFKGSGR